MIRETATAAEVYQTFVTPDVESAIKTLLAAIEEQLDYEKSFDLMIKCVEVSEGKFDKDAPHYDRLAWLIRQAYLFGACFATELHLETANAGYKALFYGEKPAPI